MLVIITEDSRAGLKFWKIIKRIVLHDSQNVVVQPARPKNHKDLGGTNKAVGGVGNLRNELEQQLKTLTQQGGRHMILVALDSVNYQTNTMGGASIAVKNLITYIQNIQDGTIPNNYNLGQIEIQVTQYYCFEEIFLTFKHLKHFAGVYTSHPQAKQKAIELHNLVMGTISKPTWTDYNQLMTTADRQFLYNKYRYTHSLNYNRDMYNREVLASLILEYITSVSKEVFFKVTKKNIQSCWYLDCYTGENFTRSIRKSKVPNVVYCRGCKVKNTKYARGSAKLGTLLTNSLFVRQGLVDIPKLQQYI